jgi:hypothetical protein
LELRVGGSWLIASQRREEADDDWIAANNRSTHEITVAQRLPLVRQG